MRESEFKPEKLICFAISLFMGVFFFAAAFIFLQDSQPPGWDDWAFTVAVALVGFITAPYFALLMCATMKVTQGELLVRIGTRQMLFEHVKVASPNLVIAGRIPIMLQAGRIPLWRPSLGVKRFVDAGLAEAADV